MDHEQDGHEGSHWRLQPASPLVYKWLCAEAAAIINDDEDETDGGS